MRILVSILIYIFSSSASHGQNPNSFSQKANFRKDYLAIDSLTKNFKTYNLIITTKDGVHNYPVGGIDHISKAFKFLKRKKISANPDVTFNILIYDIQVEKPTYLKTGELEYYAPSYYINLHYFLSINLLIKTKSGSEYNIPLAFNKEFKSRVKKDAWEDRNHTINLMLPNAKLKDIETTVMEYVNGSETQFALFEQAFNTVFNSYKKN
jgi:hypothetical protein